MCNAFSEIAVTEGQEPQDQSSMLGLAQTNSIGLGRAPDISIFERTKVILAGGPGE